MRIELRGVSKRFGRTLALEGVTVDIPSGARVAVVGPNGSGKSTLTRVIMGLCSHEGSVRLDGRDPFADRPAVLRRLAYAPQIAPRTGASVGELIAAMAGVRGLDPARVAALAGRFELDIGEIRRRPFCALSGGTRQKVLLSLALASQASLYILDEPTASLDARARAAFFRLYEELSSSATLILCSHRLEELRRLVDHAIVLEEGRVREQGPAARFLAGRTSAVVELLVDAGADGAWLREHGFAAAAGGWWARLATPEEKRVLLPAALARLGGAVRDLAVRDLEAVDSAVGGHA